MKKKLTFLVLTIALVCGSFTMQSTTTNAATSIQLKSIEKIESDKNVITIHYNDGLLGKLTFLEDEIFRFHIDPTGKFAHYATPRDPKFTGKIQVREDSSNDYSKPIPSIKENGSLIDISVGTTVVQFNKDTATMKVTKEGQVIMEESEPIVSVDGATVQTLRGNKNEQFYGGGTQNGSFAHKGKKVRIESDGKWTDGGVASPNPFYWSTNGYGVLRNTFKRGVYDFENSDPTKVQTRHSESQFDAYYFLGSNPQELLQGFYKVTGSPVLLPEYAFYTGHLNCYNRDDWTQESGRGTKWKLEDGNTYYEIGGREHKHTLDENGKIDINSKLVPETLNGTSPLTDMDEERLYKFSARAVIDGYEDNDMPIGYFLPNDGYGCGYGQNGYYQNYPLGTENNPAARDKALNDNIENLKQFTDYAQSKGVQVGLWTQSALTPDLSEKDGYGYFGYHTLRDFNKEVNVAGVRTLKTDVAWVGPGYDMALDATRQGFEGIASTNTRPNIITLNGWAGTQRHAAIWTGDQNGGYWEYIRFHIPTYIGQGLSGNPNVGSDIDGIFKGSELGTTRDIQWKIFSPLMLEMDGWGSIPKKPYIAAEENVNINRMYLKMKAELMPYLYTTAHEATNGLPMVRAMFLEFPDEPRAYGNDVQYQFMYGSDFLVAPVYQDTAMDEKGNDVRNNILLPGEDEVWVDYFSGKKYRGGQQLNGYETPLWKAPIFVRNGAIIPMYEENNNPMQVSESNPNGLDKTKRTIEFYPSDVKESLYTSYEDDGLYMDAVDLKGNEKANVSYGGSVSTTFRSKVQGDVASFIAEKSTGNYTGYDSNRNTEFVVNLTKEPTEIELFNGEQQINVHKANSEEEYYNLKNRGESVYFYNPSPNLNKYSVGDGEFANTKITTTPKLFVSFPKANVTLNDQLLIVKGFENDNNFDKDQLNPNLSTPTFNEVTEEDITPNTITLSWNEVDEATSYELMIDGIFSSGFNNNNRFFVHKELDFSSEHVYQIRSRNKEGYSEWSQELKVTTGLDPWRNTPKGNVSTNIPAFHSSYGMNYAFDQVIDEKQFFSTQGNNSAVLNKDIIIEYDDAYKFDTFTYYWNFNTYLKEIDVYSSLDGVHWTQVLVGADEPFNFDSLGIKPADNPSITKDIGKVPAKFIKLVPRKVRDRASAGSGWGASEFVLNKIDGTRGYPLGDMNQNGEYDENDARLLSQYKGAVRGDANFETYVYQNQVDINANGVFDVYDYSFILSKMDGGSQKSGKPSGNVYIDLKGVKNVLANEEFTMEFIGESLSNINALGSIFSYDTSKFEVVGIDVDPSLNAMVDSSATSSYNGIETLTMSFNNRGDKALIHGDTTLFTVKMKAKVDTEIEFPSEFMLIGPHSELATVPVERVDDANKEALIQSIHKTEEFMTNENPLDYTEESWDALKEAYETALLVRDDVNALQGEVNRVKDALETAINSLDINRYQPDKEIANISFTNTEMDNDNGDKLWQQANWKDLMFDGNLDKLLEFKWYYNNDNIGPEVKLPTDFIYTFDKPRTISEINLYNRIGSNSNGRIKEIEARGIQEDGTEISLGSYNQAEDVFTFKLEDTDVARNSQQPKFTAIVITPKTSTGKAAGTTTGSEDNRMLSISEVEFIYTREIDLSGYYDLVEEISKTNLEDYTQVSVETLNEVKLKTDEIVSKASKQADIDEATRMLQEAFDGLVKLVDQPDTSKLQQLIDTLSKLDLSPYTTSTVENLNQTISLAKEVVKNAKNQETVDSAFNDLTRVSQALEMKGDSAELDALINEIEEKDLSDYTKDSVTNLNEALDLVKTLNRDDSNQADIDAAYKYLKDTFDQLELIGGGIIDEIDTSELETLLNDAKAIDQTLYTSDSINVLNDVISKAEALLTTPTTQEEVDAMSVQLKDAIEQLVLVSEPVLKTEKLETLIKDAEGINLSIYTQESVEAFQNALNKAKSEMGAAKSQKEIDDLYSQLKQAIDNLTVKESISNKEQSGKVQTGVSSNIYAFSLLLIAVSHILYKKRNVLKDFVTKQK